MGGYNRSNSIFLSVANGKLKRSIKVEGQDKPTLEFYDGWEGHLVKIEQKQDEFEGKPIDKIMLHIKDGDEVAKLSFTTETWFYHSFFARITNCDLSKPILVGVLGSDKNEKVSFCYLKQNNEPVKKLDEKKFPKPEKELKGKKKIEVLNWDLVNEEVEKIIAEVNEKLKTYNADAHGIKADEDLPF